MLRRLCFLATVFVLLAGCGDLQTPTTTFTPTPPDFLDVKLDDAFDPKSFWGRSASSMIIISED
jgi:ABC-type uncharacterized transport system auxiliary subunit